MADLRQELQVLPRWSAAGSVVASGVPISGRRRFRLGRGVDLVQHQPSRPPAAGLGRRWPATGMNPGLPGLSFSEFSRRWSSVSPAFFSERPASGLAQFLTCPLRRRRTLRTARPTVSGPFERRARAAAFGLASRDGARQSSSWMRPSAMPSASRKLGRPAQERPPLEPAVGSSGMFRISGCSTRMSGDIRVLAGAPLPVATGTWMCRPLRVRPSSIVTRASFAVFREIVSGTACRFAVRSRGRWRRTRRRRSAPRRTDSRRREPKASLD